MASQDRHLEIVQSLLDHGAGANVKTQGHWTALHYASQSGYSKIVEALLKQGTNVGIRNDEGRTPYQVALRYSERKFMRLFSEYDVRGM